MTLSAHGDAPAEVRAFLADGDTLTLRCAAVGTTVTGESLALHRGRTTNVWQTSIRTEAGKLCAVVTQTQILLDT